MIAPGSCRGRGRHVDCRSVGPGCFSGTGPASHRAPSPARRTRCAQRAVLSPATDASGRRGRTCRRRSCRSLPLDAARRRTASRGGCGSHGLRRTGSGRGPDRHPRAHAFCLQLACAVVALPWLLSGFEGTLLWQGAFTGAVVLWVLAYINAFNFMDGIDGISVAQAVVAGLKLEALTKPKAMRLSTQLVVGASSSRPFTHRPSGGKRRSPAPHFKSVSTTLLQSGSGRSSWGVLQRSEASMTRSAMTPSPRLV